jgi:transcriptional regulator with XRE-family HTH domain
MGKGPFAAVLRQLREAAGLSRKELAGRAGVSVSVVNGLERGARSPRAGAVELLADALGLPPGFRRDAFFAAAGAADGEPEGRARRRLPLLELAVATLAVAAVAAGVLLLLRPGQTDASGAPLQVTGVRVRIDEAAVQHCPAATFTFRGAVEVGPGAGTLTYHWVRPDGSAGPATSLRVPAGTREVDVTLSVGYQGSQPANGAALLAVTGPSSVLSAPVAVAYACP